MEDYIFKAKSIFDGTWVYGYYIKTKWCGKIAHLIIEPIAEYKGKGEFDWRGVRRVDPNTVCMCDNTELME